MVVVERGGEHKIAKGDAKSRSKVKKADGHKDKDRDRKDPRRDAKDERWDNLHVAPYADCTTRNVKKIETLSPGETRIISLEY